VAATAAPAAALTKAQINGCTQEFNQLAITERRTLSPDARIADCTVVIKSGRWSGSGLAWAYANRGNAQLERMDYDRAIADFSEAIRRDPKSTRGHNGRGIAYIRKGDYDHAIDDFDRTIAIDPKFYWAYNTRCIAYRHKGDLDRALQDCNQTLALEPRFAAGYYSRGVVYVARKELDRAIADFDQLLAIDPKYVFGYVKRGEAYEAKRDYGRAIVDYGQAIAIDPKNAITYNQRCWARVLSGNDLADALADCDESLRIAPGVANTLNSRGLVYLKLGGFRQAIDDYGAAIAKNAKDADSLYGRGLARQKNGDAAGGDADIAAAKAIKPNIVDVFAGYGVK